MAAFQVFMYGRFWVFTEVIASLLSRLEINMPTPAPSAIRVPVQRIISGKVMFLSIIAVLLGEDENPGVWMRVGNVGMAM